MNHDAALYLQCGQLILDGKTPYVDFYDNNPPLIMYLSCIPVVVSNLSGISLTASFAIIVIMAIIGSTLAMCRLLGQTNEDKARLPIVLAGWFFFHTMTAISRDFGQREHIFVICAAPFILAMISNCSLNATLIGHRGLFLIGFYASVGSFLKPHFLLILFVFGLVLMLTTSSMALWKSPEFIGFATFGFLYISFSLGSPSIRHHYLGWIAPLVSQGNWAYYVSSEKLISNFYPILNLRNIYHDFCLLLLFCAGSLSLSQFKFKQKYLTPTIALCAAALTALLVYFYQAKGWPYHLVPFCFFAGLAFIYSLSEYAAGMKHEYLMRNLCLAVIFTTVICSIPLEYHFYVKRTAWATPVHKILKTMPAVNQKVIVISTSMDAYPAMIQANKQPGSRFLWFFPLSLLYSNAHDIDLTENQIFEQGSINPQLEARLLRELSEDIIKQAPGLILIKSRSGDQGLPYTFYLKNYLARMKIMDLIQSRYQLVKTGLNTIDPSENYEVWAVQPEFSSTN